MSTRPHLVLALDFGGTKLAAGVVDLAAPALLAWEQAETDHAVGAEANLAAMIAMAHRLVGSSPIEGIGVSFGGHVRANRVLRSLHVAGWADFLLEARLRAAFAVERVVVANDANAVAVAEWRFGAGRGAQAMLYITVSTGIGGGLILGGRLIEGAHGMAAEIGHTKVMSGGPQCTCGAYGCLEAVAAGPAIVREARQVLQQDAERASVLRDTPGLTAQLIADFAKQGDALAIKVLQDAGRWLGRGIANAVNLLDVDVVVVGGGVARAGDIWWNAVLESVEESVIPWCSPVSVRRSELGEHGGIWGGAAMVLLAQVE